MTFLCQHFALPVNNAVAGNVIAISVFCALNAVLTIFGNGVFLATLFKTTSLHTPSNSLLAAMCISDIVAGFTMQPIMLAKNIFILKGDEGVILNYTHRILWNSFNGFSFFLVLAVGMDRYIAVCHPFAYQRRATSKEYVQLIAVQSVVIFLTGVILGVPVNSKLTGVLTMILATAGLVMMIVCYAKISRVASKQRKAVVNLHHFARAVDSSSTLSLKKKQLREAKIQTKKSRTIGIILAVFMVCYMPNALLQLVLTIKDWKSCQRNEVERLLGLWFEYIIVISSWLNPIIYCYRSSDIRRAAWKVVWLTRVEDISGIQPTKQLSTISFMMRENKSSDTPP
eukprot:gene5400-6076_t